MGEKTELQYDVLIVGAGPAGLSAAIYASRSNLKTAIIDINATGGKPSEYLNIENYPGLLSVSACELAEKFEEHAKKFGTEIFPYCEIKNIDILSEVKSIETEENVFKAKTVIIATGTNAKQLNIPGEKEYKCKGVSYCAICDGAFFKDKTLAVIGGGNSATEEALYLTKFAEKVYLIHRRNEFKADKRIYERAENNPKIVFLPNTKVKEIRGNETVENIITENTVTGEIKETEVNGIFPYIGSQPASEMFSGFINMTKEGYIITDEKMQTSVPGVFAAGDVRNTPLRQVITAAADGAIAGEFAAKYIEERMTAKSAK